MIKAGGLILLMLTTHIMPRPAGRLTAIAPGALLS